MRTVEFTIYPVSKRESQDFNPSQFDFKTGGSFLLAISRCVILDGYRDDLKEEELIWETPQPCGLSGNSLASIMVPW